VLVVLGSIVGGHRTPAGLVMRTVTLEPLNLLNQTIVDQRAGRAIVLTSPQEPDPHCRVLLSIPAREHC
jgi:hypothetical protein